MQRHNNHEPEASGTGVATLKLGAAMRFHRMASGVSLRTMARRLGFSGHSHLADYERGRRLPCKEIVVAYEQTLELPVGQLGQVHDRALAERAGRVAAELLTNESAEAAGSFSTDDETSADMGLGVDTSPRAAGDQPAHAGHTAAGVPDTCYEIELPGNGSARPGYASASGRIRLRVHLLRPDTVQLEIMFASGDGTRRP